MWTFSKKRFFLTLGLSIIIWIISNFIQLLDNNYWSGGFSLLGNLCTLTGYPIALCLSHHKILKILGVYILNILLCVSPAFDFRFSFLVHQPADKETFDFYSSK